MEPDCIERLAVLSTGHVSKATAEILDAGAVDLTGLRRNPTGYGWLVSTRVSVELEPSVPSDLRNVMRLARRSDCAWILFDRDGQTIDGLDYFDW